MTFARYVFTGAGIWGLVVLPPLFFLTDLSGRSYALPTQYPQFYYGFLMVALAWQVAFLVIGRNPERFRLLMIPAIIEKFGYVLTLAVLYAQGRIPVEDTLPLWPDLILGVLFVAAFVKTRDGR